MSILSKILKMASGSSSGHYRDKHRGSSHYKRHHKSKSGFFQSMKSIFSSKRTSYSHSHRKHHKRRRYSSSSWS